LEKIILIGFACSGKSYLGRRWAEEQGCPFVDTDTLIEEHFGGQSSCSELWKRFGQARFREVEREVIFSLEAKEAVIATGGYVGTDRALMEHLRKDGQAIYLESSFEVVYERICKRGVPAYAREGDSFQILKELFLQRAPLYSRHSDLVLMISR